ncbi:MAG TPA: DUF6125 family protein [Thermoanaerobaculia bacterium]|nr:DUF6125 family protein [Thermoanaerobaculia bacterium]HUM29899.1 DUF6125 family protein [Thermoanaerobaculia bacterium]HXK68234.1 DUF6125 family protein [Thermoanaerobaculia bacterium]
MEHIPDALKDLTPEELSAWLLDAARLWLAHDGLWFQAVEQQSSMEEAITADTEAWRRFSPIEARRIRERLGLEERCGLEGLARALRARLYSLLNEDDMTLTSKSLVYRMKRCRVQEARRRKNLPDFPCKPVGIVEYTTFAQTIDPRIQVRCVTCPPDPTPDDAYCIWEFTLE